MQEFINKISIYLILISLVVFTISLYLEIWEVKITAIDGFIVKLAITALVTFVISLVTFIATKDEML